MKTILLLGGYGSVGRHIAPWLLRETDARLIVAGRNPTKADELAAQLNRQVPGGRVTATAADAASPDSLREAFRSAQMVLVCTPTIEHTAQVAREALAAGLDYLDMHFPARIVPVLKALGPDVERAGRCFITQAGFHPGLLAPLVRWVAPRFARYDRADVALAMNCRIESSPEAARELLEEDYQPELFVAGQWRRVGWRNMRRFDFGPDFGRRICVPFEFPEMHDLPQQLGLREAGCYVAGFNWFVDNLVFPTAMLLNRVKRGLGMQSLSRCLVWGLDTFSRPPFGVVMRLEAEGEKDGKPQAVSVVLRHADPYEFSAIPVVACMRQYLDGTIARPGVGLMGEVVEPTRLFADLQRMGICIEITGEAAPAAPGDGPRVTPSTAAGTDHRSAC